MKEDTILQIRLLMEGLFGDRKITWNDVADNEALTGKNVRLSASDMMYVFVELERQFHICLSEDAIAEYGLLTIADIARQVEYASEVTTAVV